MKILLLSPYLNFVNRGTESFTTQMQESFLAAGHEVLVIPHSWPVTTNPNFTNSWPLKYLAILSLDIASLSIFIQALLKIPQILEYRPDILWPHGGFWQTVVCQFCKLFSRHGKVVVSEHAGIGYDELKNLLCRPDAYAAQTPMTLEWSKQYFHGPAELIPEQVDVSKYRNAPKIELALPHPIVLTVASLVPYKRVENIIRAVAILEKGSILIIGDGPLKGRLNQVAKELLGEGRFIIKKVPHSETPSIYKSADVFVLASDEHECFGKVILEAMGSGLPVVVNDDPIRRWIVKDSGYLVDCSKPAKIAEGIEKALTTKLPVPDLEEFKLSTTFNKYQLLFQFLLPNLH